MTDERFCTECGNKLYPGDTFCPSCGAEVKTLDDFPAETGTEDGAEHTAATSGGLCNGSPELKKIMILTLVWAVIAAVLGIVLLVCCESLADGVVETFEDMKYDDTRSYWDYFTENGYSWEDMKNAYILIGATFLLSGVFGFISAYLDTKAEKYTASFVCLLLCAILSICGAITLIIGIVVVYYFTKCKGAFSS